MTSLNRVLIAGNLTRDPELRQTTNGTPNAVFTLAINRHWRDAAGELKKEASFIPVKTWSGTSENCARHLRKGARALVEGRIEIRSYKAKDGATRSFTEVIADRVTFLDRPATADQPHTDQPGGNAEAQDSTEVPEDFEEALPF